MNVILPWTASGNTVRVGQENTAGRLQLPIGGRASSPQIDSKRIGSSFIQGTIEQGIGDLLRKELGGKTKSDNNQNNQVKSEDSSEKKEENGSLEKQLEDAGRKILQDIFR